MTRLFAVFGLVAAIDYIPDGDFDLTKHLVTESRDAAATVWSTGERQVRRLTQ